MKAPASSTLLRRWQALPARQRKLLSVLTVFFALWAAEAMMLRPLQRQLAGLHQQVREAEQQLIQATIASAQAASVDEAFTAYAPYLQPAGSREAEMAAVLTEVESAVREAGMVLLNLKPDEETSGATVITIRVEAEASPAQLMQLLDRLQRSTHLLKVSGLSARVAEGRMLRTSLVIQKRLAAPVS